MNQNDEYAFPCPGELGVNPESTGMTLRDYFAAQALSGDMASQSEETGEWVNESGVEILRKRSAFFYRFADAMLAERKKRDQSVVGEHEGHRTTIHCPSCHEMFSVYNLVNADLLKVITEAHDIIHQNRIAVSPDYGRAELILFNAMMAAKGGAK